MTNEQPGTLPLPRPSAAEMAVVHALEGGDSAGLQDADGIRLAGLGYLVRPARSLRHAFTVIFGTADEAYRWGTLPAHAVKHLLPELRSFGPERETVRRRASDEPVSRDAMRQMGYDPIGRDGTGRAIHD